MDLGFCPRPSAFERRSGAIFGINGSFAFQEPPQPASLRVVAVQDEFSRRCYVHETETEGSPTKKMFQGGRADGLNVRAAPTGPSLPR
jgi:hypothetical protein